MTNGEALPELDKVAILALVWRDLWKFKATNLEEQQKKGPFGWLTQATAPRFSDLDWHVVTAFVEHKSNQEALATFAHEVNKIDPARGEAMLHFWVRTKKNNQNLLAFHYGRKSWKRRMPQEEEWHAPYLAQRWDEAEDLIFALENSGLFADYEKVKDTAFNALWAHSGAPDAFAAEHAMEKVLTDAGIYKNVDPDVYVFGH